MAKREKLLLLAFAYLFAIIYTIPVGYIIFQPASSLPLDNRYVPSNIDVNKLINLNSGTLFRANGFTPEQLSNEPFPATITGRSPGSEPILPKPRIRTSISVKKDWYSVLLWIMYFPILILVGGGGIIFGFIAICISYYIFPLILRRYRYFALPISVFLVLLLITITYFLFFWPGLLQDILGSKRPMVWEASPLSRYVGFSQSDARVVVVNGTVFPIDFYVDGLWVDRIPPKAYRKYEPLRKFSRFTSIDANSQQLLEDVSFHENADRQGILIYNILRKDTLWIENTPSYHR